MIYIEDREKKATVGAWLTSLNHLFTIQKEFPSDFWCWFENTATPSNFPIATYTSMRFFKSDARMSVEENPNGGMLLFSLQKEKENGDEALDKIWLQILLLLVTEDERLGDLIIGIVCKPKRTHVKFELWMNDIDCREEGNYLSSCMSKCQSFIEELLPACSKLVKSSTSEGFEKRFFSSSGR